MAESYVVLARKYRPQTFDDVVGQPHVAQTLKNAIETGRIAHAYLFSGPRGVGKTTIERILAKCLNCEKGPTATPCGKCVFCREITEGNSMDVLEIDGASNRGIDEIRDLREKVKFSSGMSRYKVYIIDEVHMLTNEAFNALLKTLEEPPSHVIFVFGTTAPHRMPATILSRCQWFALRRITITDMVLSLKKICGKEGVKISDSSLFSIARHAEGSLRDAQVSLDQVISFGGNDIKDEDVILTLGIIKTDLFYSFFSGIINRDVSFLISVILEVINSGYEVESFVKGIQEHLRNLIVLKDNGKNTSGENKSQLVDLPEEDINKLKNETKLFSEEELIWMMGIVSDTQKDLRQFEMRGQERLILEIMAIRLAKRNIEFKDKTGPADKNDPVAGENHPQIKTDSEKPDHSTIPRLHSGSRENGEHGRTTLKIGLRPSSVEAMQRDSRPPNISNIIQKPSIPIQPASSKAETSVVSKIETKSAEQKAEIKENNAEPRIEIVQIAEKWKDIIQKIKDKGKMGLAHFFEETKPKTVKGNIISAEFNKNVAIHKERAEAIIGNILKEVFGGSFKMEFREEETSAVKTTEIKAEEEPAKEIKVEKEVKDMKDEPVVKKIVDLFNATITGKKKI